MRTRGRYCITVRGADGCAKGEPDSFDVGIDNGPVVGAPARLPAVRSRVQVLYRATAGTGVAGHGVVAGGQVCQQSARFPGAIIGRPASAPISARRPRRQSVYPARRKNAGSPASGSPAHGSACPRSCRCRAPAGRHLPVANLALGRGLGRVLLLLLAATRRQHGNYWFCKAHTRRSAAIASCATSAGSRACSASLNTSSPIGPA